MRHGIFHLVDPPAGQSAMLADVVTLIDYPWHRLLPALRHDFDNAVVIRWDPQMRQGATGEFHGSTYEIVLGTRYAGWEEAVPFVFAHEVGHLVDKATLDNEARYALIDLWHAAPETHRRDGEQQNGVEHGWSHNQPHDSNTWRNSRDGYLFRHSEAYADAFVDAFSPAIARGYPRFVHTTRDVDAVRDLTLRRPILAFTDIDGHTFQDDIEWAAREGIAFGDTDGKFRPNETLTRAQMCAFLRRALDKETTP